ncbi:hypothetical protein AAFF_G00104160 [Aldrovandia affinis]|uniref:Inner centromere protein n=1 Tax=Aldrovandia affinis TaxID=143900 RepID=A0AAD7T1U2_9TELE|nr:hypothetical protein AAFF_G00104160 [Aldrovandia affinis]
MGYGKETSMSSLMASTCSLLEMFDGKLQEFASNVDKVHMVWLEEIQQEANRMFSSDFSAEPELMPKTPSQKKRSRRKRVSSGRDESLGMRRFSKGKRSNLRTSSVHTLKLITEDEGVLGDDALQEETSEEKRPKRNTRRNNKQKQQSEGPDEAEPPKRSTRKGSQRSSPKPMDEALAGPWSDGLAQTQPCPDAQGEEDTGQQGTAVVEPASSAPEPQAAPHTTTEEKLVPVVKISTAEPFSVELQKGCTPCRTASKLVITRPLETAAVAPSPRRSSVRHSLTLRRSLAGLRHSMTQESVRRASRRSFLKKVRMSGSSCSSSASGGVSVEIDEEEAEEMMDVEHPAETETDHPQPKCTPQEVQEVMVEPLGATGVQRVTRSMAQTTPPPPVKTEKSLTPDSASHSSLESDDSGKRSSASTSSLRSRPSTKRRAESTEELSSPLKKASPPQKSHTAIRPNMKSFLHTVQKNQLLMSTPGSLSRSTVVKSFIKRTTPLRVDLKPGGSLVERERLRLEALRKKQEQEIERKKKMEEEKRRKQEEMKRKRDERLRKVVEARVKEEQREEEKKKKIEQKLAQMEVKNDKLRVERLAEEKAKKKVASKRQEELELRKKQDEEARRKRILLAEEEEKRQQELLVKRRAEEEQERARRLAEVRRAVELRKELEREREQEQERERLRQQQATAERERLERVEREKALALQRELEKAAREKEQREAEQRKVKQDKQRLAEQDKQRLAEQDKQRLAEQEKQRLAEQDRAAAVAAAPKSNFTTEMHKSIMKTPVGKATGLNVTVDIERSPQSYEITPKGGTSLWCDDSTDDESAPRKPIPSWAEGRQLQQAIQHQYFNPVDLDSFFGAVEEPKLEKLFYKSKPRYFKRTSSAVWQSPPRMGPTTF